MILTKGGKVNNKTRKPVVLSKGKIIVNEETYQKYGEKILRALHGGEQSEIIILKEGKLNENISNG